MEFDLNARLWQYPGKGAWYFITLPKDISQDIEEFSGGRTNGFGSLKVSVSVGSSTWETSIFPDAKSKTYFLPIKSTIRKAEKLEDGDSVQLRLNVRVGV